MDLQSEMLNLRRRLSLLETGKMEVTWSDCQSQQWASLWCRGQSPSLVHQRHVFKSRQRNSTPLSHADISMRVLDRLDINANLNVITSAASRFRTFKRIGQKYYVTDGHVALFDGALSYCSTFGASLVLPRTNVENQALAKLTEEYPAPHSFIGTTDRKHEGQFTDLYDRPLTFTKWGSGEPQNAGSGEDCVIVIPAGTWHDVSCDSNRVVCEISL